MVRGAPALAPLGKVQVCHCTPAVKSGAKSMKHCGSLNWQIRMQLVLPRAGKVYQLMLHVVTRIIGNNGVGCSEADIYNALTTYRYGDSKI